MKDIYVRLYPIPEDNTDTNALEIPSEQTTNESPYSPADTLLLEEFTADYDEIMVTLIGENYAASLIDMTLSCKIKDLYDNKWISKADTFADPSLKSFVFGLLGELNNISNSLLVNGSVTPSLGNARTKIRNLYVKLHPDQFAGAFPYDAFTVVPFQIAYAVSIHKAQGLEYDSVKIVITDEVEELVTHNIFYTAITRAREKLKIYWTPEVEEKVINRIKPRDISKDVELLRNYLTDNQQEDSFDFWL